MNNKVWTRAEVLDILQPKTADKETKKLWRELGQEKQLQKFNELVNFYGLIVA